MNRVLAAWREIGQDSLNLPNLLTLTRILLIPVFVVLFVTPDPDRSLLAAIVFVVAAVTDMLDGYLARRSGQVTKLGKLLDPIADKLLVGAALILLVHDGTITQTTIWAALIIMSREILVSGLREFLAELNVRVHVSRLAKWKTTLQMIALGVLLIGPSGEAYVPGVMACGGALLWMAAILTLWTGGGYLTAAIRSALHR